MHRKLSTPLEIGQIARSANLGKLHRFLESLYKRATAGSTDAYDQYELIERMFEQIYDEKHVDDKKRVDEATVKPS